MWRTANTYGLSHMRMIGVGTQQVEAAMPYLLPVFDPEVVRGL